MIERWRKDWGENLPFIFAQLAAYENPGGIQMCIRDRRYMMRIRESRVKLGEELEHVENYVKMQEIRFPGSILLVTECPEKLNEIRVPHLLLHTIVENVFKHAMSLTETLMLMISCREIEENGFRGVRCV